MGPYYAAIKQLKRNGDIRICPLSIVRELIAYLFLFLSFLYFLDSNLSRGTGTLFQRIIEIKRGLDEIL
jgi:hypothetical protein